MSCNSLHYDDLSAQVARLASSDDHLSYGSLAEITALRNKLMEFKAPIARYQSKVSAENVERQLVKQGSLVKHSRSKEVERHFLLVCCLLMCVHVCLHNWILL